ncbi:EF-P beta-lysylation protein EpmB [Candidatus Thioglobus sp.]|jgi:L-lysine 2,3-aminomutase (EC 5.4.3.2)|uniref:EF-P beta-lysylation protein EpmB n=1 Tax=Candidatus Thioglobus sp. TaxID=2026721 RepID=UPI001771FBB9|nr:EF-P beta-lysylation protein EpmB [Candidatus Thioglobus sp.]
MNHWQYNSRHALKDAKQCNNFFQTTAFKDQSFPIKVPLEFANLIDKSNPDDPLLKQVANSHSLIKGLDFNPSPLADEKHSPVNGLIHKYPNRVLLITTRVCTIHCQYCFRQNFDYASHDAINNWNSIKNYIHQHTDINEVILSGGDPLSLSDDKLHWLISNIEQIPHIKTLRIHSRTLVVTPSRITDQLVKLLNSSKLNVVVVLHSNHANELSGEFVKRINKLKQVTLLNQSVLLKGVNDSVQALSDLSLRLFDAGVLPYYLHLLDKVSGAEHFLVDDECAKELHQQLKKNLSGYLVPRLVRDENGEFKAWIG